ncbi:hypothetical protein [Marinitoga sp. 38H-ov]|uniref:hypothetical protein n=1 Tax=Marinitoga sp. 38H-ov TaxID=1755814 RepID=UPI0019D29472|nr:hypothetical protein [Marinitoga sp. 38H-ov]
MFKSKIRYVLNIFSWILIIVASIILFFSYVYFRNNQYLNKMEKIKRNEEILNEYNLKIKGTKNSNEKLYEFLNFLENLNTKTYIQSLEFTPESLNATVIVEVIDGMKIISAYEIKEIDTIDLYYKQYKILGMKK